MSIIFPNKLESVAGLIIKEVTDFSSTEDLSNGKIVPESHDKGAYTCKIQALIS